MLVALDLRPIALEAPKQEYYAVLNEYFRTNSLGVLTDFLTRLYVLG